MKWMRVTPDAPGVVVEQSDERTEMLTPLHDQGSP
jgi:hypothetical protein